MPALGASVQSWGSLCMVTLSCTAEPWSVRGVSTQPLRKELSVTISTQIPAL